VDVDHIESYPGFVTERQNDSLCLSVIKQILAERRVATRLGALRIGSDFSSCRGPSMRGIALACGSIYTLYMYIAGRRIRMYIHVQVYIHGRQSDRKTKLSCETITAAVSRIGAR